MECIQELMGLNCVIIHFAEWLQKNQSALFERSVSIEDLPPMFGKRRR
jgi:hypothetical protein